MGHLGRAVVCLMGLGVVACGDGPPIQPVSDLGPPPRVGLCTPRPSEAVSAVGQWAALAELNVELNGNAGALVALCPNPQVRPSRLTMRAVITDDGSGQAEVALQVCRLDLPTINGAPFFCPLDPEGILAIEIANSDAFAALLPTLDLSFGAGVGVNTVAGASFDPEPFSVVMGADLPFPTSPLPIWDTTRPGCEDDGLPADCVQGFDQLNDEDGDGNVGVTLQADSGEGGLVLGDAYVVVRIAPSFAGSVQNSDCIDGTVALNLDFNIIDSDLRVIGQPLATPVVIDNIPPLNFLPSSGFKMLRADEQGLDFDDDNDGTVSCAEIINNEGQFLR